MSEETPFIQFYRLVGKGSLPERADKSALGTVPTRAFRYCEPLRTASGFGYYVYPAMDFDLLWDGEDIFVRFEGIEDWEPLPESGCLYPGYEEALQTFAPESLRDRTLPWLAKLIEPGTVQIWTGLIARTEPGVSIMVRGPVNVPTMSGGYVCYEGIVETDRWFGPLFSNIRLTRIGKPVSFRADWPLFQVLPLHRETYSDARLSKVNTVDGIDKLTARDWADFEKSIVKSKQNTDGPFGGYATEARKRAKSENPGSSDEG